MPYLLTVSDTRITFILTNIISGHSTLFYVFSWLLFGKCRPNRFELNRNHHIKCPNFLFFLNSCKKKEKLMWVWHFEDANRVKDFNGIVKINISMHVYTEWCVFYWGYMYALTQLVWISTFSALCNNAIAK